MGESLTVDKTRHAAFLFTGAGTWVGISTYLAIDSMTIQESRQAISQTIMDH